MKKWLIVLLCTMMALALAACGGATAPAQSTEQVAEPTSAPEPESAEPDAEPAAVPHFVAVYADGTPLPSTVEAKTGKENAIQILFNIENSEGVVGWDAAFDEAGISYEMNFEGTFSLTVWSESPVECTQRFYLNASRDFANLDIQEEQYFNFIFTK